MPVITSVFPTNGAKSVDVTRNISINFDQTVVRGTGLILLRDGSGNIIESFDAATSTQLFFYSNLLSINPAADLAFSSSYSLELPADSVRDASGSSFAGLTAYRFNTLDPLQYIASYGDLINAFGTNTAAAASHFTAYGSREGRVATFDALAYTASYGDLISAFGTNTVTATTHYINFGFGEGRTASFSALRYTASYGDLIGAFGTDTEAASKHFINFGFSEGRTASFDALRYIASYSDLVYRFGTDVVSATAQYINTGFGEGRTASFDALSYVASYGDLITAFKTDAKAATEHYIRFGLAEGRSSSFDAVGYLSNYGDLQAAFGADLTSATAHYINFGAAEGRQPYTTRLNLSAVAAGTGGFVINGQDAADHSGVSVASAGDVNGDGLDDLIIGASLSDPSAGSNAGRSYVVFGKVGTFGVDLSAVAAGTGGFVINGQSAGDHSGISVASAGDVNGDGLADLIVGASGSNPSAGVLGGRSYVVFGKAGTAAIDLSAVASGIGGFSINRHNGGDQSGISVASAGDINSDGLSDLIIGAHLSDPASGADAGRSYIVFGKTGSAAVELSEIAAGTGGFVINGQCASDSSGFSVSSAGDINGDGVVDLIVGAPLSDPAAGADAGRSYVISSPVSARLLLKRI